MAEDGLKGLLSRICQQIFKNYRNPNSTFESLSLENGKAAINVLESSFEDQSTSVREIAMLFVLKQSLCLTTNTKGVPRNKYISIEQPYSIKSFERNGKKLKAL